MNIDEIKRVIPHRYPFLLIDAVHELEPGKRAVGIKNVTVNEPFFGGHFPGRPIMPGVLIVEALAQIGAVAVLSLPENDGKLALFTGIDNFRFRRQVVPGDTLRLEIEMTKIKGPVGRAKAAATVDGCTAAEGTIIFALVDQEG